MPSPLASSLIHQEEEQKESSIDPFDTQPSSPNPPEHEQKENGSATEIRRQNGIKEEDESLEIPPTEPAALLGEDEQKERFEKTTISSPGSAAPVKSKRGRKSLKTLSGEAGLSNIPDDEQLFQRQYYSIGEVATMFGVNASLLRFWESEFSIIQPMKNRKGDRHFRPVDIKNLQLIHDLLRRRKLTIEGAKTFLKNNKRSQERFEMIRSLQQIRSFLLEIKASL
ncbi:MAG: MerR family transcriptional regulator [Chitinophagaceae bacterium]|nr:MerR family transcriptional regulator [Chitinophagaceae bacterium]